MYATRFIYNAKQVGAVGGLRTIYTTPRHLGMLLVSFWVDYLAKYKVRVIQDHGAQTFITYLGGWEGRSPVRRGCGAQPRECFFDGFLSIFG